MAVFMKIHVAALVLIATTSTARAEYAELGMAKEFGTVTLGGFGVTTLVLSGFSVSYLSRGPGEESGRNVVAICEGLNGSMLIVSGLMWQGLGASARQGSDSTLRLMTAAHVALGIANFGLAIVTRKSYSKRPAIGLAPILFSFEDNRRGTLGLMAAGRF